MSNERIVLKDTSGQRKGHRLWIPISIVVLATAAISFIWLRPELELNFRSWMVSAVVILSTALIFLWFLLLSRVAWSKRLVVLAILLVTGYGFTKTFRVDGTVNGTGLPRFKWRWASHTSQVVDIPKAITPANVSSNLSVTNYFKDVPQFFGPDRDGIVRNAGLSKDWSNSPPKQLWRQPVGAGWSAFAVVDGQAFTQEQSGENEVTLCLDLLTGQKIWTSTNAAHFSQWQGGDGPRATPAVYDGKVYTMGATGILDCLDATTGRRIWSHNILNEYKLTNIIWGLSDSPLVYDESVVVTGGANKGPTLLAFDRLNGEPLWHSGSDKASYASPMLATICGRRVVLSVNAASLTANDPKTGELLLDEPWSTDKWPKASQPVVIGTNKVFLSAGYGTGCELLEIQTNAAGKFAATKLWQNLHLKTQFNSVAARDGFLYGLDDSIFACMEISTGERKWKDGRYGAGQSLLVDDMAIIQGESGAVDLVSATPDGYVRFGSIPALNAKTWNHPTLAGRYLLVRNSEEMACYELPVLSSAKPGKLAKATE